MDWRAGWIELDTRADTCVAGKNFRLAEPTGETVDVTPFSEEYNAIGDVPIGTVETAYTCPKTGETIILVGHQHLYFGDRMNHSLWNPNQIRNHDGKVYDCPKQFDMDSPFVIELMDDEDKVFEIPLKLHGVIQYIDTHYPSDEELATCCRIEYTSDAPWDPYSSDFEASEQAAHSHDEHRVRQVAELSSRWIAACSTQENDELFQALTDSAYGDQCNEPCNEPSLAEGDNVGDGVRQVSSVSTQERHSILTEEQLARRWGIGIETARSTIWATTQVGVRRILHPVDRRYRTRRADLKFPTANKPWYADTAFFTLPSVRRKTCAEIFTDTEGYDHFYSMKSKSEAGDALNMVIEDTKWIPRTIITDRAPEEIGGTWNAVRKKFQINQRWTEPYSPWQNAAENSIRKIKKGIK